MGNAQHGTGSGLQYMHARYYGPFGGRFLSVDPGRDFDPSHPQSWNVYAYVRNNPVNAVDADGRVVVAAVPACYGGAALVSAASAWLLAPNPGNPTKTNVQVMGESLASLAQVFAKTWRGPGHLDPGVARQERDRILRAEEKARRRFGPKQPKGSDPLPPAAPGPHTEIGQRPHLQNAPSEVGIWTALATAEVMRQVLVNSIVHQCKTWVSPAAGEKKLGQKPSEDAAKAVVKVTAETNPHTQDENKN